jgi:Ankyrin repeats (3 copies)
MKPLLTAILCLCINASYAQAKKVNTPAKKSVIQKTANSKKNVATIKDTEAVKITEPVKPKNMLKDINLSKYVAIENEQTAIDELDELYPNTVFTSASNVGTLLQQKKINLVKHLINKFELTPTPDIFQYLHPSQPFVCGVGLKRKKDYSPACLQVKVYEHSNESQQKLEMANFLLYKGVKPDYKSLACCIVRNELEIFKVLFNNYSIQNYFDCETPKDIVAERLMETAADCGMIDFVKFLLENNVSANAHNHSGLNQDDNFYALYRSVKYPEIFDLLVKNGADINVVGYCNTTVILHAAREGCVEVVQYLLDQKIDPYQMHGKWSAYDMAKKNNEKNKKEILELLKKYKK